jgi:hypothetical protein
VKHAERAIKHFMDGGAVVVLVEIAFNRRELVFADSGLDGTPANCGILGADHNFRHQYIGLHTKDELWHKEAAIRIGVQHLPYDWQQVAWLDADIHFLRSNWVGECIHKLQHYSFLQLFSQARDLSPDYEILPEDYPHSNGPSFVHAWKEGFIRSDESAWPEEFNRHRPAGQKTAKPGYYGAAAAPKVFPGLAWACTRKAWEDVGGLMDFAIWGGADHHQAYALIEKTEGMMRHDLHQNYQKLVMQWYHRCRTHIRRNVGCMEGAVFHAFHGSKERRGYFLKHGLLAKLGFDPLRHLKRDYQGLYQLHDDRSSAYVGIRDMMRKIAMERDEDSTWTGLEQPDLGH